MRIKFDKGYPLLFGTKYGLFHPWFPAHLQLDYWISSFSLYAWNPIVAIYNYINPGSQIPQVDASKRCSRDLFTSSGRATALMDRHFWYAFLQQSMTRLTNTAILLTYASRFHWRFSGNWQEHICERNTRCFGSPGHLSLGSDRLNVTVCRTCTVPLWDVQRTVGSWSYWKNILGWLALRSSSSPHLYSTVVFGITFWGKEGRMTVWL